MQGPAQVLVQGLVPVVVVSRGRQGKSAAVGDGQQEPPGSSSAGSASLLYQTTTVTMRRRTDRSRRAAGRVVLCAVATVQGKIGVCCAWRASLHNC